MRRLLTRLIYGFLSGFIVLVALLYLLVGTPTGSRWLLNLASHLSHGAFTYATSQGSLLRGLRIGGLHWQTTTLDVRIGRAGLRWRPLDLLAGRLEIAALGAQHILIVSQTPSGSQTPASTPDLFPLALAVRIADLRINDLVIVNDQRVLRIGKIQGALGLSGNRLTLTPLSVATPQGQITLHGHLFLTPSTRLDLKTTWDWKFTRGGQVVGRGDLQGPLSKLDVTQQLIHPFQATLKGRFDVPRFNGTARLSWQNAHWPLVGKTELSSSTGTVNLTGGLAAYHLMLSAALHIKALTVSHVGADVEGNREGFTLKQFRAALLGGTLEAKGKAAWRPDLAWQLAVKGSALNPGVQWTAWPGRINLALQLAGNDRRIQFSLSQLDGQLRTRPITARSQGRLDLATEELFLETAHVSILGALLDVSGQASPDRGKLRYSLDLPKLSAIDREAAGQVKLSGSLAGPWAWPRIQAHIEGKQLRYRDLQVGSLNGTIVPTHDQDLSAKLDLKDITRGRLTLQTIRLEARGRPEDQQFTLAAHSARVQLALSLAGGFRNGTSRWQGRLLRLGIQAPGNSWQLKQPVAMNLSRQSVALTPLCLQATSQATAHFCTTLNVASQHLQLKADWAQIPLSILDPLLPSGVHAGGHLSGQTELSGPMQKLSGSFSTQAPDAFMESGAGKQTLRYALPLNRLSGSLHTQRVVVTLKAGLPDQGVLDARLDTGLAPHAGLNGQVHLMLPDLVFTNPLLPDIQDVAGTLKGDLTLTGTRAKPQVGVQLTLSKGAFTLPQTGIHLSHIEASLSGQPPSDNLNIALKAQSGPGTLDATGILGHWLSPNPQLQLKINGQRFEAVNLPQVTALISPALTVDANPKLIQVRGKITVPQADIHLKRIPAGSVDVSEDTHIVGASPPAQTPGPQRDISVDLVLGQAVKVDAFGLTGRLAGGLLVNQTSNSPPSADGSLSIVNGTYAAYGLKLAISRGVINFAGPLDNPGLDFVAQRQTGDVTAQLTVTGTLKSPHSQVSATPPMSESEALSWLITGHGLAGASKSDAALLLKALASMHLDQGGGNGGLLSTLKTQTGLSEIGVQGGDSLQQSALLLGKYLTPELYVRYSAGLFDHSNALALTYQLSRHFSVEAKSGTAQGIDLLYQIVFGPR